MANKNKPTVIMLTDLTKALMKTLGDLRSMGYLTEAKKEFEFTVNGKTIKAPDYEYTIKGVNALASISSLFTGHLQDILDAKKGKSNGKEKRTI